MGGKVERVKRPGGGAGDRAGQSETSLYILGVCRTLTAILIRWVRSRVIASIAQGTPSFGSVTDTTSHSGPRPPK